METDDTLDDETWKRFKAILMGMRRCAGLNNSLQWLENFKRPPYEVEALMRLAKQKLLEICANGELLEEYGVRLNVLGKTSMLPPDVQEAVRKAEEMTRHHDRAILNLCMAYTGRDDMTTAIQLNVQNALKEGNIDEITQHSIDAQMMTSRGGSPPLDIFIRTSGVKRLSDFLLWQCCEDTQIHFVSTYWPEFGLFDFIPIILDYQRKAWSKKEACQTQPLYSRLDSKRL